MSLSRTVSEINGDISRKWQNFHTSRVLFTPADGFLLELGISARSQTRSSADADNRHDAFSSQSRSPNIVPFHMLGIVSYCAIVTLSSRRALFTIFDFKKCCDLEIGVRGHSMSLKVVPFDRACMVYY